MVEVSVMVAKDWHQATGAEQWTYEWKVPTGSGNTSILSRAVDDSVNIEKPGKELSSAMEGDAVRRTHIWQTIESELDYHEQCLQDGTGAQHRLPTGRECSVD